LRSERERVSEILYFYRTGGGGNGNALLSERENEPDIPGKFWYIATAAVFFFCAGAVTPERGCTQTSTMVVPLAPTAE